MKKLVLGALVALGAFGANASYLYWQVSGNESWSDTTGFHSGATTVSGAIDYLTTQGYTPYKFVFHGTTGDTIQYGDSALTSYSEGSEYTPTSIPGTADTYVNVAITEGQSYSYYIEIQGYKNGAYETVAQSGKTTLSYAQVSANLTDDLGGIASAQVAVLTGPSYAAPEPTGAMLLLVGGALLALKRKRA